MGQQLHKNGITFCCACKIFISCRLRVEGAVSNSGRNGKTSALEWIDVQEVLAEGKKSSLKALLEKHGKTVVNLRHGNGMTVLHFMCATDGFAVKLLLLLLDKGADVNARDEGEFV